MKINTRTGKPYKKSYEQCEKDGHINSTVIHDEYADMLVCHDCGYHEGEQTQAVIL